MINKIIHQVWVGDKPAPNKWLNTWKEHHPDWGYILWDNGLVKNTDWQNSHLIEQCMNDQKWHGVADLVRYEVIHRFGGVAMPADSECVNPIDELIEGLETSAFTCYENESYCPGRLTPIIGANRNNKWLKRVINGLTPKQKIGEPWIESGNQYLTDISEGVEDLTIFPSYYFMPNHYRGGNYDGHSKIYSKQYSGTTFNSYGDGV